MDPDPNPHVECGSGSRRAKKWPTNIEKSKKISCFEVLDVLYFEG
jgi:hypothetical protein